MLNFGRRHSKKKKDFLLPSRCSKIIFFVISLKKTFWFQVMNGPRYTRIILLSQHKYLNSHIFMNEKKFKENNSVDRNSF